MARKAKSIPSSQLWIVVYSHRHGTDVWPLYQAEMPAEEDIIEKLEEDGTWDGEDEYVEIRGPFPLPS